MDLFDAIAKRASYRGAFTAAGVPREHLVKIIEAGRRAPAAKNDQTTSLVIIDDERLLAQIAAMLDRPVCNTARAMIVCVADPRPVLPGMSFALENCAATVENMLLAITALGYATVWLDGVLRRDDIAGRIARLLGVPTDKTVRVVLPIGVPAEPAQQKEKLPFDQRAWFNAYGVNA